MSIKSNREKETLCFFNLKIRFVKNTVQKKSQQGFKKLQNLNKSEKQNWKYYMNKKK